jgi:hypothetical protein
MKKFKFFSNRYCYIIDDLEIPDFIDNIEYAKLYYQGWTDGFYGRDKRDNMLTFTDQIYYDLGWGCYIEYDRIYNVM